MATAKWKPNCTALLIVEALAQSLAVPQVDNEHMPVCILAVRANIRFHTDCESVEPQ
jgi:hypothetical protein